MKAEYKRWLELQKYDPSTVNAQIYRTGRVEEYYGDLDNHYATDRLASVIEALRYSMDDQRRGRENPSKIPFEGNIRNNLASYRNAIERYCKFRDVEGDQIVGTESTTIRVKPELPAEEELGQRFGLERDLQVTLRKKINELEEGLSIIDEGAERSVDSGFIDITAKDADGIVVVIELKAGVAGQRAVAQILSYMGDVSAEEENGRVRGILIASDFDSKARAAVKVIPTLTLRKYSVQFHFSDGLT